MKKKIVSVEGARPNFMKIAPLEREFAPARNTNISKIRYVVEQAFPTLKPRYGLLRAHYIGRLITQEELLLCSIAFNLRKPAMALS